MDREHVSEHVRGHVSRNLGFIFVSSCEAGRVSVLSRVISSPADTCRHLQTPADTCRHLQTPSDTCRQLHLSIVIESLPQCTHCIAFFSVIHLILKREVLSLYSDRTVQDLGLPAEVKASALTWDTVH